MSNRLETYLSEVERHLSSLPTQVRDGELREMRSHLEQLAGDLRATGHDEDQAAALAIARFGSERSNGLGLRDTWEGNRGVVATFFAVLGCNWLMQILNWAGFSAAFLVTQSEHGALIDALSPLFVVWAWCNVLLLPFVWNFTLGRWGGRRVALAAALTYLPLSYGSINMGDTAVLLPPVGSVRLISSHLILLMAAMSIAGACYGSTWKRRQRLALVVGASFEQAPAMLSKSRRSGLRPARIMGWGAALGLMAGGVFAWAKPRADAVLHPATREAAVRVLLADPDPHDAMLPSTNVTTRLLSPSTPAERANGERRVAYTATMHATPDLRERYVRWMQRELQAEREGRWHEHTAKSARAALERLKPEGYRARGVLHVIHTPQGWRVNTSGGARNQPWAWLYLIGYEDQPGVQP